MKLCVSSFTLVVFCAFWCHQPEKKETKKVTRTKSATADFDCETSRANKQQKEREREKPNAPNSADKLLNQNSKKRKKWKPSVILLSPAYRLIFFGFFRCVLFYFFCRLVVFCWFCSTSVFSSSFSSSSSSFLICRIQKERHRHFGIFCY